MFLDLGFQELAPVCVEALKRALFVCTHEPAVAGDIAGEDGGQSPFNALFGHIDCPTPGGRMEFMAGR